MSGEYQAAVAAAAFLLVCLALLILACRPSAK